MTNYQLRGQIGGQLIAVNNMYEALDGADDTPVNIQNRGRVDDAWSALRGVYDSLPANNDTISDNATIMYNRSNVMYKTAKSLLTEFGTDSWPSFGDAVVEAVKDLPNTISTAAKEVAGAAGDLGGGIVETALAFIKPLLPYIVGGIALLVVFLVVSNRIAAKAA